jgi:hypothetical protein
MRNRLASIGLRTDKQIEMLKEIHKHMEDLTQGSEVTSISAEAQNQIRTLLKLSQAQCKALARSHMLKGLAAPSMNMRFEDVANAHQRTFQWLFAHDDTATAIRTDHPQSNQECISSLVATNSHEKELCALTGADVRGRTKEDTNKACSCLGNGVAAHHKAQEWSVWQLDDGYEEDNQDWWYKRGSAWVDETWKATVTAPDHKHLLQSGMLFIEWLASGDGIFHISGKLGSGKSTLMKYLYKHPRTRRELAKWAGMLTIWHYSACNG